MDEIRIEARARSALEGVLSDRRSALFAIGVVGVLALGGLSLALRASPAQVAPPSTYESWTPSGTPSAMTVGAEVLVHVTGEVKRPGLYPLLSGARFADAIRAAGGPTSKADLNLLNLAQLALDGTKIEVPRRGSAAPVFGAPPSATSSSSAVTPGAIISLNSADQAALETIPGIGPVTATAILAHRDEIGGFTSLEQLMDVSGIGPATYEAMRDSVSL